MRNHKFHFILIQFAVADNLANRPPHCGESLNNVLIGTIAASARLVCRVPFSMIFLVMDKFSGVT